MKKFKRRLSNRHSKLGRKRKKKQVWRSPKGRDNKMREKRRGYPAVVKIGYGKEKSSRKKIKSKNIIMVNNLNDLNRSKKEDILVLGSIGKKKKIGIVRKAKEMKLEIYKMNIDNFLKKTGKEKKK